MKRKDFYIPSKDGVHRLHVVLWEPETKGRAVVQISHGMIEMIDRYEDFALFLNQHGYAVIGNDHLGHGLTAGNDADLGYFCPKNMSATVVADLHRVTKYAKKKYKNKPYFLLGHSMGSFMARRYLMAYGMELDGAVICGTGSQSWPVLVAGPIVANTLRLVFGDRFRSKLLEMSAFGAYQKRIPHPRTKSDWMTRDTAIVDFCRSNKYCNFIFTVNGYRA
ncbi:MAG: alpha/beta hydrolase, partial [Lachnospiraceae bacterium]|nr:alpha/beta hydrolase [Lachnospiraceae bacterium]